jgi:hypothetical protein
MKTTFVQSALVALLSVGLAGCCFGGTPGTVTPPPPVGGGVPPVAGGPMVTLAPGFAPDPMTLSGIAGGPVSATTLGASCTANIAAAPNHILNVTAPFASLRVTGNSSTDTVLVIRMADGRVVCNDDGGGYPNPQIMEMFGVGQHQVWVGTFSAGTTGAYTLSVSAAAAIPSIPGLGAIPGLAGMGTFPGVPTHCGMTVPDYGPIMIGSSVVLGSHTGWSGPDGRGGYVTEDTWWNDEMWAHVGQRTVVTELAGVDPVGCPYIRVAIDGGSWGWRIRNLSP